jgi:hypothetical protein
MLSSTLHIQYIFFHKKKVFNQKSDLTGRATLIARNALETASAAANFHCSSPRPRFTPPFFLTTLSPTRTVVELSLFTKRPASGTVLVKVNKKNLREHFRSDYTDSVCCEHV